MMRPVDLPNTNGTGNAADIGSVELQTATAASVSISGRVIAGKRGVANATVYLTDHSGNTIMSRTNPFGYYQFDNVAVGQTLIFNVSHKQYQFDIRVISLTEEMSELDFTGDDNGSSVQDRRR